MNEATAQDYTFGRGSKRYVFTYGTLKKGYHNNILLRNSTFICEATTKPKYRLYDCGMYPCMVEDENGVSVSGEIYEVNKKTLESLDHLEGVPWLYKRGEIEINDFNEPVIAYFYQNDVNEFEDIGGSWPRKK